MKTTIILLTISNIFMTLAWYGHLKHKQRAMWLMILVSWLIAFVEYCFQVPANRIGHDAGYTTAQLKTMQEIITLVVFVAFSITFFPEEKLSWNHFVGFALIAAAGFFIFNKWN